MNISHLCRQLQKKLKALLERSFLRSVEKNGANKLFSLICRFLGAIEKQQKRDENGKIFGENIKTFSSTRWKTDEKKREFWLIAIKKIFSSSNNNQNQINSISFFFATFSFHIETAVKFKLFSSVFMICSRIECEIVKSLEILESENLLIAARV